MASGFAPEFLILLGIDVFLGASILTVLLERHFPAPFPYVLEGAALIGFAELMSGPTFLNSLSTELQFWYSFIYAIIAVLSLFATNLYLLFLRRRAFESAILGICGTVPAGLGILYFTSAFVNGLTMSLPLVPVIPIEEVYAMFGLSIGLVVFSLVFFGRRMKPVSDPLQEKPILRPIITRTSGGADQHPAAERRPSTPEVLPIVIGVNGSPYSEPAPPSPKPGAPSDLGPPKRGGQAAEGPSTGGLAIAEGAPAEEPGGIQNSGTILVKKVEPTEYTKRLLDSIRFFEKAVDHPVKFDPALLGSTFKGAKKAYLTPAGMMMVEDSTGKTVALSLMDIATDEALRVMRDVMKGINSEGGSQ